MGSHLGRSRSRVAPSHDSQNGSVLTTQAKEYNQASTAHAGGPSSVGYDQPLKDTGILKIDRDNQKENSDSSLSLASDTHDLVIGDTTECASTSEKHGHDDTGLQKSHMQVHGHEEVNPGLLSTPTTLAESSKHVATTESSYKHYTSPEPIKSGEGTPTSSSNLPRYATHISDGEAQEDSNTSNQNPMSVTPKVQVIVVEPAKGEEEDEKKDDQETESLPQHEAASISESMNSLLHCSESNEEIKLDDQTVHNNNCKSIYAKLMARKSEKPVRDKVTAILKTWETSGKLEELEKSVNNINKAEKSSENTKEKDINKEGKNTKNIKETTSSTGTIAELANALKSGCDLGSTVGQIELAYKVYYWVATNICYSKHFLGISKPESILQSRLAVCQGYSTLFQAICREAGLDVARVSGHTRSLFASRWTLDDADCHTWNVVKLENVYFQVDCTHGSGTTTNNVFQPNFTRVYFFPAPEKFIMTHWVKDELFQLLEHPVSSIEDLQQLVVINQKTASLGIEPRTLSQCIRLNSNSTSATRTTAIEIRCARNDLELSASLKEHNKDEEKTSTSDNDEPEPQPQRKNDNSLTLVQWNGENVTVHVALPAKGTFVLKIYSAKKNCDDEGKLRLVYNLTSEYDSDKLEETSEYVGYPYIYRKIAIENEFSLLMDELPNSICKTTNQIELRFKLKQNVNLRHSICNGQVEKQGDKALKCYTHIKRDKRFPDTCTFTALFPKSGWWTVFLISEDYYKLMRYQVYATAECTDTLYPHVTTDAAEALGISLLDEHAPLCYDANNLFELKFTTLSGLAYKAKLEEVDEFGNKLEQEDEQDSQKACRTFVSVPRIGSCTGCVYAIIPLGTWRLDLYANEPQFSGLNHVISAKILHGSENMKMKVLPFIFPSFSKMGLYPPPNLQEWILPEVVESAEYPKTIKIPFLQYPGEFQVDHCSVEYNDKELDQIQDLVRVETVSNDHNTQCRARVLETIVSKSGKWKFVLKGRHLRDNDTVKSLIEYAVRGL